MEYLIKLSEYGPRQMYTLFKTLNSFQTCIIFIKHILTSSSIVDRTKQY